MDAILDTSVIIELFKGNKEILEKLSKNFVYGISVVTFFELHCGTLKERGEIFLDKIPKLSYDEKFRKTCRKNFQGAKEGRQDTKS